MQNGRNQRHSGQHEEQQLLDNALTSVASAVFITAVNGKIIWINEAFSRLSGFTPEDLYGSTSAILHSGRQTSFFYADLWHTIREGEVWHGQVVDQCKDGSLHTAEEVITPLFNVHVGASIGIALYAEHGKDSETVLICADHAMYEAKRRGGNDFLVCPPKHDSVH